ncbi:hypothetical protein F5884DRAFT_469859 [Xylogone sp. PMI_703]|nr:hypothetical protein F5884DRAFT_469859 [Xylogone sp. PMI_703]
MLHKALSSTILCLLLTSSVAAEESFNTRLTWHWKNNPHATAVSPIGHNITITTPPDTDIWRPAKTLDNFTAPYLYTTVATHKFQAVQVSVTAHWKTLYDQGGLVVVFPSHKVNESKWIKAGIEYNDGAPRLGVVGTDILSDWSLSPITEPFTGDVLATISIERQGTDAWVYVLEQGGATKRALRQVTWAFNEGVTDEIQVGIYSAKPTEESGAQHARDPIKVSFSDFSLQLA